MNGSQSHYLAGLEPGFAVHAEEYLHVYFCGYLDFSHSGVECSQRYPNKCVRCKFVFQYLTGESVNEYQGWGHLTFRIFAAICIFIGILGIIGNTLIIAAVQRRVGKRSFDFLILTLAYADNLCCLSCISYCAAETAYFDNFFSRGFENLCWTYYSALSAFLWRIVVVYITLFITVERYISLAYPFQSRVWVTLRKTKINVFLIIGLATVVTLCRGLGAFVGENIYGDQEGGLDIPSAKGYQYAIIPTKLHSVIMANLVVPIYIFEYWAPIVGLLVLNVLTLREIKYMTKRRQDLGSAATTNELQPARMFLPVAVIFLCTNFWPPLCYQLIQKRGYNFREGWALYALVTTLNSSANFCIYYFRSTEFRNEVQCMVKSLVQKFPAFRNGQQ